MFLAPILDALGKFDILRNVPTFSWLVLLLSAFSFLLVCWLALAIVRWAGNWRGAVLATFEDFVVSESADEYIVVHASDVPSNFKTGTDVTISVSQNGKTRRAQGTIRRKSKNFAQKSIAIPRSLYPALFNATDEQDVASPQKIKIDQAHRFFLERWVNHSDDETRLQVRFGLILAAVSLVVGFLQGYVFEFLWTKEAAAIAPLTVADCRAPLPDQGAHFEGEVSYVGDGDGLCVGFEKGGVLVRLHDFRALELNQKGGAGAKRVLRDIALGAYVRCESFGSAGYRRVSAVCRIDGESVGDLLRKAGLEEGGR